MILSLVLLNLAGGDCISDIERLEQDAGFRTLLIQFATHGMKRSARRAFKLDGVRYKLFAVVTNRDIDGSDLIQWHRKHCGKSEHVHSTQKEGITISCHTVARARYSPCKACICSC